MIKGEGGATAVASYQGLADSDIFEGSISLASGGQASLTDIKPFLIKVAKLKGSTFLVTKEDSLVSVFLYKGARDALEVSSTEIDGGIQTLKTTGDDIVLYSSTGEPYSLLKSIEKANEISPKRSEGLPTASQLEDETSLAG